MDKDNPNYVSPTKFNKLTHELQARILMEAKGQSFTKQHRLDTIEDRIRNASNKSITESDAKWLFNTRDILIMTYIDNMNSIIRKLSIRTNMEYEKITDESETIIYYDVSDNTVNYSSSDNSSIWDYFYLYKKEIVIRDLTNTDLKGSFTPVK